MAYMNKEHAREIRNNLKKEFPNFKFSVKINHHSSISISLMKSPLNFDQDIALSGFGYIQLNHYYLERYSHSDILKRIKDIVNEKNWDESNIQFDHFDVGFYVNMNIGQYDKPYIYSK